ncbi:hypothetical protein B0H13DRAFT_1893328 [Mycena leptocephala]|nr:hypothetical protein B0H13DRAFT_1893328 [Mycena leptocephala]
MAVLSCLSQREGLLEQMPHIPLQVPISCAVLLGIPRITTDLVSIGRDSIPFVEPNGYDGSGEDIVPGVMALLMGSTLIKPWTPGHRIVGLLNIASTHEGIMGCKINWDYLVQQLLGPGVVFGPNYEIFSPDQLKGPISCEGSQLIGTHAEGVSEKCGSMGGGHVDAARLDNRLAHRLCRIRTGRGSLCGCKSVVGLATHGDKSQMVGP